MPGKFFWVAGYFDNKTGNVNTGVYGNAYLNSLVWTLDIEGNLPIRLRYEFVGLGPLNRSDALPAPARTSLCGTSASKASLAFDSAGVGAVATYTEFNDIRNIEVTFTAEPQEYSSSDTFDATSGNLTLKRIQGQPNVTLSYDSYPGALNSNAEYYPMNNAATIIVIPDKTINAQADLNPHVQLNYMRVSDHSNLLVDVENNNVIEMTNNFQFSGKEVTGVGPVCTIGGVAIKPGGGATDFWWGDPDTVPASATPA